MMKKNTIITISRQFGSGGHEVGKRLSEKLGFKFYDNELIHLAAAASGLGKEFFAKSEESKALPSGSVLADCNNQNNDKVFAIKADIIKQIAERGNCVIVGRCADYILESWDSFDVFVHAPMKERIARVKKLHADWDEKTVKENIQKAEIARIDYYTHYAGREWGQAVNYSLCIDSSVFGIAGSVKLIVDAVK